MQLHLKKSVWIYEKKKIILIPFQKKKKVINDSKIGFRKNY